MKNYNNYINSLNEKVKWYWWLLLGSFALNQYTNYISKNNKEMFNSLKNEKEIYFDWIETAKGKVINKINNSNIKNRKTIIDKIKNCKIVDIPNKMDNDEFENTAAFYTNYDNIDYVVLNHIIDSVSYQEKIKAITHELFHLVDHHRIIENKPNIEINKNISKEEYAYTFFLIIGFNLDDYEEDSLDDILDDFYENVTTNKKIKYLSDEAEIYARFNNLKLYLFEHGYISSPNDDISYSVWKSIFNGNLFNSLSDKEKKLFINYDFIDILPFIKDSKLSELNKLAYLDKKTNTDYIYDNRV